MAIKYFADLPDGKVLEFSKVDYRTPKDAYGYSHEHKAWIKVNRKVNYKSFGASKHVCDARCMNATGRQMNCECSCGGKNHGKGFKAEAITGEAGIREIIRSLVEQREEQQ